MNNTRWSQRLLRMGMGLTYVGQAIEILLLLLFCGLVARSISIVALFWGFVVMGSAKLIADAIRDKHA